MNAPDCVPDRWNYGSVPLWPHSISPVIPMVSHALPWMQWALSGAKRLESGSLLPLCCYAQTTCLSSYWHPANSRGRTKAFVWHNRGPVERCKLNVVRWTLRVSIA